MDFSFSKITKNFLKKKVTSVIGIDIGSSAIKVIQIKKDNNRAVLETYGELALGPYEGTQVGRSTRLTTDKVVEALNDIIKEAKVTTKIGSLAIPMKASMVTLVRLPKNVDQEKLSTLVPIEARKYIPVPADEVTMDWFTVPQADPEKAEFFEVIAVAIHNDTLSKYNTIITNSGIETNFLEVEMFSTARAVIQQSEADAVLIVDMGAGSTKSYIIDQGIIRDSHVISKGSQDLTLAIANSLTVSFDQAEQLKRNMGNNQSSEDINIMQITDLILNPIFSEINSVANNYQRKFNKKISKAILTGGGFLLPGITDKAKEKIGLPIEIAKPFSKVSTPAFLKETLEATGYTFSTAIGLALRHLQEIE